MKKYLIGIILVVLISFEQCSNNKPTDLSALKWTTIDSSISINITKEGDSLLKEKDPFVVEESAMIDKRDNKVSTKIIPDTILDSIAGYDVNKVISGLLNTLLIGKINRNSEGYLKVDLFKQYPRDIQLELYLSPSFKHADLDSLLIYLKNSPRIVSSQYISPDDAIAGFSKTNPDIEWKKYLDHNPLPASVRLNIKEEYVSEKTIEALCQSLKDKFPVISDASYSKELINLMSPFAMHYLIFHYKT
jgi:hypothetical protein